MLSFLAVSALAASESSKHYHSGKLGKYELGPPALVLSSSDETRLRSGRSVLNTIQAEDGGSRMIMVQDIQAPAHVVLGRIMDLNKYPEMVSGCDACATYADTNQNGIQTVKATYEISALHMKFKYYVTHVYDPAQRCMVFHLDYDRQSDLDDTVGYWYVDTRGARNTCRVYYSCECKLRGWVPGPVYKMLTEQAVKKATTWVERESVKEWRSQKGFKLNPKALLQFADTLREQVKESVGNLQLPSPSSLSMPPLKMPTLPSLPKYEPQRQKAFDWFAERRRAATRLVGNVRPPPKRTTTA